MARRRGDRQELTSAICLQLGVGGQACVGYALSRSFGGRCDRLRCVQYCCLRDIRRRGQFTELRLVQRIVGRALGQRMAEAAIPRSQQRDTVVHHAREDARDDRMDEQLQRRVLHRRHRVGVIRRVGPHLVARHRHAGEHRGAGAALPKAVPVVDEADAFAVGRHHHRGDRVVVSGGGDGQVVGEQRASAVVLLAAQPIAARRTGVGQQPGVEHQAADGQRALFAERVAEDLSLRDLAQPLLRSWVMRGAQPLLDEPEVCPEDMGHNGIGMRDVDRRGE